MTSKKLADANRIGTCPYLDGRSTAVFFNNKRLFSHFANEFRFATNRNAACVVDEQSKREPTRTMSAASVTGACCTSLEWASIFEKSSSRRGDREPVDFRMPAF